MTDADNQDFSVQPGDTVSTAERWKRVGADGLPPLALDVFFGRHLIGRVVDATPYKDFPFEEKSPTPSQYIWEMRLFGEREQDRPVFVEALLGPDGAALIFQSSELVIETIRRLYQPLDSSWPHLNGLRGQLAIGGLAHASNIGNSEQ